MAVLHHVKRPRHLVPEFKHSIPDATADYSFDSQVPNRAAEQIQSAQKDVLL